MNKNQFAVTITGLAGSKHFFVKSSIKRDLIVASVSILVVMVTSFALNYFQFNKVSILTTEKEKLNSELVRFDTLNSSLNNTISEHREQFSSISKELVEIERSSGVDTGDLDIALEKRIQMIGQFYNAREYEYSVIDSKVEQIEDLIGMDKEKKDADQEKLDMATRVELASLTASQERILHDSIPSGFPTTSNVITSEFGNRKHPVTKVKSFHKGVDIRAKSGEEIYATADGFVSGANYSDLSGNRVVIYHNFGFETRYSHLKEMLVTPGDVVHKGDLVGYSGNTGLSSAPHLHYEIRYLGKSINPSEFLDWEFGSHEIFTQVRGIKWPSLLSLINKQITHQTLQLSQLDPILPAK